MDYLRVIPYARGSASFNMAADELLLQYEQPCLRLYGWSVPTLSFGRSGAGLADIDRVACSERGIALVRRITGGKTVLHDQELTYSLVLPKRLLPKSPLEIYFLLAQILQSILKNIGVESHFQREKLSPSEQQSTGSICFREASSYELTIAGKKLMGNAQRHSKTGVLQHGSLLLDIDWELWYRVWRVARSTQMLERRVISLAQVLDPLPAREQIAQEFIRVFAQRLRLPAEVCEFSPTERRSIAYLEEKYSLEP